MKAEIPNKLFYKIGEVSALTGVQPYVLRYWESEFKLLRPKKNRAGQRVYRRPDLDLVMRIKQLLYEERLTLEGAKKRLRQDVKGRGQQLELEIQEGPWGDLLRRVRTRLEGMRQILKGDRSRHSP
ncbi:MAG: MerR family transcriptional regulator [Candidatus Rokubacteria bacterium]|nr:MerR family transcriptional regulator [Candidatus Rokubacteria bacterium]